MCYTPTDSGQQLTYSRHASRWLFDDNMLWGLWSTLGNKLYYDFIILLYRTTLSYYFIVLLYCTTLSYYFMVLLYGTTLLYYFITIDLVQLDNILLLLALCTLIL
jgi:hypothetical protein